MTGKRRKDKRLIKTRVLTLRMSEEEMLRFKVSALTMGKKRSRIVRERVADLIGVSQPEAGVVTGNAGAGKVSTPTAVPTGAPLVGTEPFAGIMGSSGAVGDARVSQDAVMLEEKA